MLKTALKEYFRTLHHKKHIRVIATTGILVGLPFVGVYSTFFETKRLKQDYLPFQLNNPHSNLKGLKICQISDLHYGPTNHDPAHFQKAIDLINANRPDLVFLTGDYYQWDPAYLEGLPKMLSRIRAKIGVFASLGNHDYGSCYPGELKNDPFEYELIKETFEKHGLHVLANEHYQIQFNKQKFNIVGLHDLWSGFFDPDHTFNKVDNKLPTFVLSHNPDTAGMIKPDFDLMFSGHSHGGQVSWPFIGSLSVPMKNKHHARGFHPLKGRKHLYVNRGLGHTFKMRLNSLPEVTLVEIV